MRSNARMANRQRDVDGASRKTPPPVNTLAWLGWAWLGRYLLQVIHKFVEINNSFELKVDSDTADSIILVFFRGPNNHENLHSVVKIDLKSLKVYSFFLGETSPLTIVQ